MNLTSDVMRRVAERFPLGQRSAPTTLPLISFRFEIPIYILDLHYKQLSSGCLRSGPRITESDNSEETGTGAVSLERKKMDLDPT